MIEVCRGANSPDSKYDRFENRMCSVCFAGWCCNFDFCHNGRNSSQFFDACCCDNRVFWIFLSLGGVCAKQCDWFVVSLIIQVCAAANGHCCHRRRTRVARARPNGGNSFSCCNIGSRNAPRRRSARVFFISVLGRPRAIMVQPIR
jgi:hypothetical protein